MSKGRLEAFSDGVIAIIITIMVLELKVPHGADLAALADLVPVFLTYVLSFVFVGIYWNNHHHLLQATRHVSGAVLWANLHLLFWLSLIPFVTGWMGENHFEAWPVATYGTVLLMAAIAYTILTRALVASNGRNSPLGAALGNDLKGNISLVIYMIAIPLAFLRWWIACGLYVLVALIWFVPDRRIEKVISTGSNRQSDNESL
ncbi:MAG TPA: TMEM175 family protein [Tepidisphaeraceae bacterium]|nr:TMEM175 family protein [Tepidisphaeraceae bacterium]